jgi:hypothetical protein
MIEEPLVVFIGWDVQSFLPLPFSRCLYQPCNALLGRGSLHTSLYLSTRVLRRIVGIGTGKLIYIHKQQDSPEFSVTTT